MRWFRYVVGKKQQGLVKAENRKGAYTRTEEAFGNKELILIYDINEAVYGGRKEIETNENGGFVHFVDP